MDRIPEVGLYPFPVKLMKKTGIALFAGKRGSGKSTAVRAVMKELSNKISVAMAISATERADPFYSKFLPDSFVHESWNEKAFMAFTARQQELKTMKEENGGSLPFDNHAILIEDDCAYEKKVMQHPLRREAFYNGRHWDMMIILVVQYVKNVEMALRDNIDYVFIQQQENPNYLKGLYENFGGVAGSYANFVQIITEVTENYGTLVIDRTVQSNDIRKRMFYFNADPNIPPFRFGAPWYWQKHEQHYIGRNKGKNSTNITQQLMQLKKHTIKVKREVDIEENPEDNSQASDDLREWATQAELWYNQVLTNQTPGTVSNNQPLEPPPTRKWRPA